MIGTYTVIGYFIGALAGWLSARHYYHANNNGDD